MYKRFMIDSAIADPLMQPKYAHKPVMLDEVLEFVVTDPSGLYLDATVGLGGHSEAILKKISAQGKLLGIDLDPEALHAAETRLKPFAGRFRLIHGNFRNLGQLLEREKFFPLAGALMDLGVSSLQLEKGSRGFAIYGEGPLDMRMDPTSPLTADRILNEWPAEQLALLFKEFGEEPQANRIARAVAARRASKPFTTTTDLKEFIESKIPKSASPDIHPATRAFMALRIAVNRELENLTQGLESILPFIQHGGRVAVITFHSLEDRIVKNVLKSFVDQGQCVGITASPVRPTPREVESNPRARSAKLRVMEKK